MPVKVISQGIKVQNYIYQTCIKDADCYKSRKGTGNNNPM